MKSKKQQSTGSTKNTSKPLSGLRVYVAGSSKDLKRVKAFIAKCKRNGAAITYDWTVPVAELGSNPEDYWTRSTASSDCRVGVQKADVVIALPPEKGHSLGLMYELGYAQALHKTVYYVHSLMADDTVFFADVEECPTDNEAYAALVDEARIQRLYGIH